MHYCTCLLFTSHKLFGNALHTFSPLQTEKALQVALEASQSESAALKLAYQYSSEKYAELKSTYEDLLEQLKEEVSC